MLETAGVPCGPVNTLAQALDDPLTGERGLIVETKHDHWGTVRHVRTAARGWWPRAAATRAPRLGEHRDEVLTDLIGYSPETIRELGRAGAFGADPELGDGAA